MPTRDGGFAGLAVEVNVPVLAIFFAGAAVVGAIWAAKMVRATPPPAELESARTKLAVSRATLTN